MDEVDAKMVLAGIVLDAINRYLMPALKDYASESPGILDNIAVRKIAKALKDPKFLTTLRAKLGD